MTEERVYKLENGKEIILLSTTVYEETRYLLLLDEETDEVEIGFEKNGSLLYLDKDSDFSKKILLELYNKLKTLEI